MMEAIIAVQGVIQPIWAVDLRKRGEWFSWENFN